MPSRLFTNSSDPESSVRSAEPAGTRRGLILSVPPSFFSEAERATSGELIFVAASDVRGLALASARTPLTRRFGVEVGVAVVERRAVGYLDVHPDTQAEHQSALLANAPRGVDVFAIFGVGVVATGQFESIEGRGEVVFNEERVPVADLLGFSSRFESVLDSTSTPAILGEVS